jgi:hypothetical protein
MMLSILGYEIEPGQITLVNAILWMGDKRTGSGTPAPRSCGTSDLLLGGGSLSELTALRFRFRDCLD